METKTIVRRGAKRKVDFTTFQVGQSHQIEGRSRVSTIICARSQCRTSGLDYKFRTHQDKESGNIFIVRIS